MLTLEEGRGKSLKRGPGKGRPRRLGEGSWLQMLEGLGEWAERKKRKRGIANYHRCKPGGEPVARREVRKGIASPEIGKILVFRPRNRRFSGLQMSL